MQDVNHQLFTESVIDEVLLGMRREDEGEALKILDSLSLLPLRDAHPMSLSGGEKQRLAIAAAIASEREIVVFDEPTSGLDCARMRLVAQSVQKLNMMGKPVFVITHDPELILACCTHVLEMEGGESKGVFPLDLEGAKRVISLFSREGGEFAVPQGKD
jgi:energy-coupling factor transport system ATP-binding protein